MLSCPVKELKGFPKKTNTRGSSLSSDCTAAPVTVPVPGTASFCVLPFWISSLEPGINSTKQTLVSLFSR